MDPSLVGLRRVGSERPGGGLGMGGVDERWKGLRRWWACQWSLGVSPRRVAARPRRFQDASRSIVFITAQYRFCSSVITRFLWEGTMLRPNRLDSDWISPRFDYSERPDSRSGLWKDTGVSLMLSKTNIKVWASSCRQRSTIEEATFSFPVIGTTKLTY